ncbi:unnamed protein product [Ostreobium quekettii]|uniref:Uncharacterized protein n=1 Tax=Ostreobium quekettii TaxID=121088 RepID=A0A8S1ISS5_9CHLO|nr:unnamed protein product [Ostreobium quekettii]
MGVWRHEDVGCKAVRRETGNLGFELFNIFTGSPLDIVAGTLCTGHLLSQTGHQGAVAAPQLSDNGTMHLMLPSRLAEALLATWCFLLRARANEFSGALHTTR